MVGLFKDRTDNFEEPHRLDAIAPRPDGNFKDLESLLEQLGAPPVFELGNPLPQEKFMPKPRVGDCHASHNRFLLDEGH
jgi:hypothetical protein